MRTVLVGPCPVCPTDIDYLYQTEEIPYFSDILIISARCPSCGYRYVDTQMLKQTDPIQWTLAIETPEDLSVRVVRSMNGRIEIPELGVVIDPGTACEGFVTNVEGVLNRVDAVLEGAIRWAEGDELVQARLIRERIAAVKAGTFPVTLFLEDPTGNSLIVSEKAQRCSYEPEPE